VIIVVCEVNVVRVLDPRLDTRLSFSAESLGIVVCDVMGESRIGLMDKVVDASAMPWSDCDMASTQTHVMELERFLLPTFHRSVIHLLTASISFRISSSRPVRSLDSIFDRF
jgi:hypothetical protein